MAKQQPSRLRILSRHPVFRVCRFLFVVYFGVVLGMAFFQRSLIYYPFKVDEERLRGEAARLGWEEWLGDGGAVAGWRAEPSTGRGTLVIFHGNAGHAAMRRYWVEIFESLPPDERFAAYYVMEYPGYGFRAGKPSEKAFIEAAQDAMATLQEAPRPIVVLGESLGSGVATAMAAELGGERIDGLLLVTPFDRLGAVAHAHFPFLPVDWFLLDRYNNARNLREVAVPMAVVVAERDQVVPARFGEALYAGYAGPKQLHSIPRADHNTLLDFVPNSVWREVLAFLRGEAGEAGEAGSGDVQGE